jgi:hypothetical protein
LRRHATSPVTIVPGAIANTALSRAGEYFTKIATTPPRATKVCMRGIARCRREPGLVPKRTSTAMARFAAVVVVAPSPIGAEPEVVRGVLGVVVADWVPSGFVMTIGIGAVGIPAAASFPGSPDDPSEEDLAACEAGFRKDRLSAPWPCARPGRRRRSC